VHHRKARCGVLPSRAHAATGGRQGVTLIVIGQWIGVAAGVVLAVAVLLGWRGLEAPVDAEGPVDLFTRLGRWSALVLLLVSGVLAVLAWSFGRLRSWARVLFVVVLLANAVGDVVAFAFHTLYFGDWSVAASSLVKLPLSLVLAWYLSRPRVKSAFAEGSGA
jgi:hypothetical protein